MKEGEPLQPIILITTTPPHPPHNFFSRVYICIGLYELVYVLNNTSI